MKTFSSRIACKVVRRKKHNQAIKIKCDLKKKTKDAHYHCERYSSSMSVARRTGDERALCPFNFMQNLNSQFYF